MRRSYPYPVATASDSVEYLVGESGGALMQFPATDFANSSFDTKADVEAATIDPSVDAIHVLGYATAGDGGAAVYKRVVAEPAHAGKIQSADGAWWEIAEPVINVLMFGADPTFVADSTLALNSALGVGRAIYFPQGKFKFTAQIVYTIAGGGVSFTGAGTDLTILYWASTSGLKLISNDREDTVTLTGLTFTTDATGTSIGLHLLQNDPALGWNMSNIIACSFRADSGYIAGTDYWSEAIKIEGWSSVSIHGCGISGANAGIGINVVGRSGVGEEYALVLNISSCNLMNLNVGLFYNELVQGVAVSNTNFGGHYGIYIPNGIGGPDQLTVVNCQFGPLFNTAIWAQSPCANTLISNCVFYIPDNDDAWGILLEEDWYYTITNNTFHSQGDVETPNGVGLGVTVNDQGGIISGNIFTGDFAQGIGNITTDTNHAVIINNYFYGTYAAVINTVADLGTGSRIEGNAGYNPVGASTITVGASPYTYTAGVSPETVYVSGGTISSITIQGGTAGPVSPCSIPLGPNEAIVVTYTVAPTMTKMVH
jgi:hypothetical protein